MSTPCYHVLLVILVILHVVLLVVLHVVLRDFLLFFSVALFTLATAFFKAFVKSAMSLGSAPSIFRNLLIVVIREL